MMRMRTKTVIIRDMCNQFTAQSASRDRVHEAAIRLQLRALRHTLLKSTMASNSQTSLVGKFTEPKPILDRLSHAIVSLKRSRNKNASCRIVRHLEVPVKQNDSSPEQNRSGLCREYSVRLLEEVPPVLNESQLEILETIAAGAFGRAMKVRHRQLGCLLVVKEVLNNSKENEETLVREVSVLRNLTHPNILTCLAIVVRNKRLCLVTEYIDRGSIHQILLDSPEEQPPSICTRVSFARDIATGMIGRSKPGYWTRSHRDAQLYFSNWQHVAKPIWYKAKQSKQIIEQYSHNCRLAPLFSSIVTRPASRMIKRPTDKDSSLN
ncbi:LIM domain kinase 1 [Clonorchis sinensis]|uniref:LIM domain kinase 1 n=1 Tax=Clonorchis sinensis TaxID=79923 RepID=G7YXS7_CLOSI|nr:LIM domain kinase 1 [Clonorchis sinensis]